MSKFNSPADAGTGLLSMMDESIICKLISIMNIIVATSSFNAVPIETSSQEMMQSKLEMHTSENMTMDPTKGSSLLKSRAEDNNNKQWRNSQPFYPPSRHLGNMFDMLI